MEIVFDLKMLLSNPINLFVSKREAVLLLSIYPMGIESQGTLHILTSAYIAHQCT